MNLLVVIAHSARALAQSAARAGYQVVTIDAFADVDTQQAALQCWCLPLSCASHNNNRQNYGWSEVSIEVCLTNISRRYPQAHVILGAGAERYAPLITSITAWKFLGCSPEIIDQVTTPHKFFAALDLLDITYPTTSFTRPRDDSAWLQKTISSCGGLGVVKLKQDTPSSSVHYWQREQTGVPISALVLADGIKHLQIGINQQIMSSLEGLPYVYSGAIANVELSKVIQEKISTYTSLLVKYFKLKGLFSLDMIWHNEEIYVLEINPRISASYELYERLNSMHNLVDAHIRVCEGVALCQFESLIESHADCLSAQQLGYRIVFAETATTIPEVNGWPEWLSDRPGMGQQISAGEPLCTVFSDRGKQAELEETLQYRSQLATALLT